MTYFLIVTDRKKEPVDESGPFDTVEDALSYISGTGHFTPPDAPGGDNGHISVDAQGITRVVIRTTTAGIHRFAPNIYEIVIRRDDVHLSHLELQAKSQQKH